MTELKQTRTTRMPAFWEYPQPPHDYPYYWFISDPKSKQDKVKITNLPKIQFVKNFAKTLNATHILKQLNKMCKYEMDLASTVEVTERTRFCPQMDGQNDGRTSWNQYAPTSHFQLHWSGGCNNIPSPISLRNICSHVQVQWTFHFTIIQLLAITSQQIFAHGTTAQPSCHGQNFVAIVLLKSRCEQNKSTTNLHYNGKIITIKSLI